MFAKKKAAPQKRRQHDLSQFGLTEIPDDFDPAAGIGADDAGDSDLEAELAALAGGNHGAKPKAKPKAQLLPANDLDRMIAESLRDVGSDEELSADENDPDLLGELNTITGGEDLVEESTPDEKATPTDAKAPQLLLPTSDMDALGLIKQRLEMYTQAEANAKAAGEAGKARRFNRGLKTLKDLLKQAQAGKQINVDDIPPEVSVKPLLPKTPSSDASTPTNTESEPSEALPPKVPSRKAPSPPTQSTAVSTPEDASPLVSIGTPTAAAADEQVAATSAAAVAEGEDAILTTLQQRQSEYKAKALEYKRAGDTANALQFVRVVKQFDMVIKMHQSGQQVDLSDMPPPPAEFLAFMAKMQESNTAEEAAATPAETAESAPAASAVETPTNLLEALQQRLDKYKSVESAAKAEDNASKARRFGRIVKQYEDAIRQHKAGRPVQTDELPVPPGFGPLPVEGAAAPAATTPLSPAPTKPAAAAAASSPPSAAEPVTAPTPPKKPSPQKQELTTRTSGNQHANNLAEQQMKILLERQQEFKLAAVAAKKAGEIEQAKEYLKIFKGFDALLNAASSGLPVDLSTLPLPPSQRDNLEASFAIITTEECDPDDPEGDISDISVRIEEQLAKQLMMCKNTRDHHKAMGDVAGMNRFENLAITVQKDLDLVRYNKRHNHPLPKFHYEKKSFNIVHCNTDLTDNELEIVVVRGLNYNVPNPKEVNTYVRIEFPLLNDESYKAKTNLIKDTDSPDYDQHFKVDIQRSNRQFQRIFKRHGVKFEVFSRGGFLRSDILIGTVNVKLQPLETKCDIHETFNLMEGRKVVGGKLEIKLRVRNPILTKQMEHINEKWLVLDT